eukprot:gnl/Spiro4/4213_TR2107_c0_g2_i1.p1 gnl/Spiro4/4213_TR2107_c0_g2~~gnl/Spiro4/4213_TR2107_c0_g2_i1.p1  ORF type:complete len:335 (+),score=67.67 gnl/Spiro4/4213_TR2107_c0_g2_i1:93-1097(+)
MRLVGPTRFSVVVMVICLVGVSWGLRQDTPASSTAPPATADPSPSTGAPPSPSAGAPPSSTDPVSSPPLSSVGPVGTDSGAPNPVTSAGTLPPSSGVAADPTLSAAQTPASAQESLAAPPLLSSPTPQTSAETAPASTTSPGVTTTEVNSSPPSPPGRRPAMYPLDCATCLSEVSRLQDKCKKDQQVDCGTGSCAMRSSVMSDAMMCNVEPLQWGKPFSPSNCIKAQGLIKRINPKHFRIVLDPEDIIDRFLQSPHVCDKIRVVQRFCKKPVAPVTTTRTYSAGNVTKTDTTKSTPILDCVGKEPEYICNTLIKCGGDGSGEGEAEGAAKSKSP